MQYFATMANGEIGDFNSQGKETGLDKSKENLNKSVGLTADYDNLKTKRKQKREKKKLPIKIKQKNNKQLQEQLSDIPMAPYPVPAVPPKMLFTDFIPEYLLMQKYQLRQNTYEIYKITAEAHVIPYFKKLNLAVQEITTLHIQHYFHVKIDEGLSPSTLKKHYTIINGALSYAMYNMQMIMYNPAERVKRPPAEKKVLLYYNVEQIKELLLRIKGHTLETIIILASHYGLRRSEVIALRWDAIDFSANTVTIKRSIVRTSLSTIDQEKNKSTDSYRTMPLMPDIKKYLQKLYVHQKSMKLINKGKYTDNDLICKRENGEPFRPDYVTRGFASIVRNGCLPNIRFHDLRHSAASILFNAGYNILLISFWLGHADVNTTKRYIHIEFNTKMDMSNYMNDQLGLAELYKLDDSIDGEFWGLYSDSNR